MSINPIAKKTEETNPIKLSNTVVNQTKLIAEKQLFPLKGLPNKSSSPQGLEDHSRPAKTIDWKKT